ncbi:hypothetical protein SCOCK_10295 [Actinacidiphila cocklensis]|uniref:Uncharacterized protein n=1 Tax=Actinacidiphila cocklensis TaxID=887465 RepID=A0A9W4DIM9_9ACTN|nr:hypothetical protein SCOCK_10295 [Actinacidiphila cocklensis]
MTVLGFAGRRIDPHARLRAFEPSSPRTGSPPAHQGTPWTTPWCRSCSSCPRRTTRLRYPARGVPVSLTEAAAAGADRSARRARKPDVPPPWAAQTREGCRGGRRHRPRHLPGRGGSRPAGPQRLDLPGSGASVALLPRCLRRHHHVPPLPLAAAGIADEVARAFGHAHPASVAHRPTHVQAHPHRHRHRPG